jgi:hypothetical protein
MYIINNREFHVENGLSSAISEIQFYLNQQQLVLVRENGTPFNYEEIEDIINTNSKYKFDTMSVKELEHGFINETIDYIDKVEKHFEKLSTKNDKLIINTFIDVINSLAEIAHVTDFRGMDFWKIEEINEISRKAVSRIEVGDINYLVDILEFEIVPGLLDYKMKMLER